MATGLNALIDSTGRDRLPARSGLVLGLGGVLLGLALLATWLGADDARRRVETRAIAEATLRNALAHGNRDDSVRSTLVDLRRRISRRPLDSKTRVAYATLWLGLSRRLEDLEVAAFHARRAAELAPVTLPVVRPSVLVLGNTYHMDEALALIRSVFLFEPTEAAILLASLDHLLDPANLIAGIPDSPEAWLAWSSQLADEGRKVESRDWLEKTFRRWPEHPDALHRLGFWAAREGDLDLMAEMFPPDRVFPNEPEFTWAVIWRARLKAERGDREGALRDVQRGLGLHPRSCWNKIYAAEVYQLLGNHATARDQLNRALFCLPAGDEEHAARSYAVRLLAKLEDEHGEPAAALRWWQSLAELDPSDEEARNRIDTLTGFRR